jgi:hypothetical protein
MYVCCTHIWDPRQFNSVPRVENKKDNCRRVTSPHILDYVYGTKQRRLLYRPRLSTLQSIESEAGTARTSSEPQEGPTEL